MHVQLNVRKRSFLRVEEKQVKRDIAILLRSLSRGNRGTRTGSYGKRGLAWNEFSTSVIR